MIFFLNEWLAFLSIPVFAADCSAAVVPGVDDICYDTGDHRVVVQKYDCAVHSVEVWRFTIILYLPRFYGVIGVFDDVAVLVCRLYR